MTTNNWAMLIHLSVFAGYFVPGLGLVAPILIWQLKKEVMPELDAHGKIVTNFILSAIIYSVVAVMLSFLLIGIPLLIAIGAACLVLPIIGGIKANSGEAWPYPLTIKFLK